MRKLLLLAKSNRKLVITLVAISCTYLGIEPLINRSHCEFLRVSRPFITLHNLGKRQFESFQNHAIWLSAEEGDLTDDTLYDRRTDNFNYDGLYRLTRSGKSWLFRHGGQAFNNDGSKRTLLYDVEWEKAKVPDEPGIYEVEAIAETKKPSANATLNTVGDSITWWQHGEHFRCMLADAGLNLDFAGSRTDSFGYGHDGEGGNNTRDILKRINAIAPSSHYFLLVGTNDRFEADETIKNILQIAHGLKAKSNSMVFVSTLLPRTDEYNQRNEAVNKGIKQSLQSCADCKNIMLIDTNRAFLSHPDWKNLLADGLHPNKEGYAFLTNFIVNEIRNRPSLENEPH